MEFAPHARPSPDFADSSVSCSLRELGPLSLEPVASPEERRRWEAMIETHHPEGWRRPPGGQVRYRVRSERYGVLGGLGFTAAGIQLGPRDDVVGWSGDARVANIGKVVCNHRFLLLPGVRVKGLASRVLRLATGRIADDWAAAYGERPVLVQSFTGPGQSGLSYRAAGWKCCPQLTSGRRSGAVTITLLTRAVLCGTHDACRLACDSFARKLFRGLSARSLREARAGARLRASCALARTGATRGASRAFRRRGRSCRGWRRNWG